MKKLLLLLSAIVMAIALPHTADARGSQDDYNFKKALEIIQNDGDKDEALDLLDKQLSQSPDHIMARLTRVAIYKGRGEFGLAMADINFCIKTNRPKKSKVFMSTLYWWKGDLYDNMQDYESAVTWYGKAMEQSAKDNRDNLQKISFNYAQALEITKRYNEAKAVYTKMIAADETDTEAMTGYGHCLISQGQYDEALTWLEKARRISPEYEEIYRFQAMAYERKGDKAKAVDAAIEYFERSDDPAWSVLTERALKHPNYAEVNVKARLKTSDKPIAWHVFLADFYENLFRYADALREYQWLEKECGREEFLARRKANCYILLGLPDAALREASAAVDMERSASTLSIRGVCYWLIGQFSEAVADLTAAIEEDGRNASLYSTRAWTLCLMGENEKALESCNVGIDIDSTFTPIYLRRGLVLKELGRMDEARKDFEHVVTVDTVAVNGSCTHFALQELGRAEEAEAWIQKVIDTDPRDFGNVYDQACLYARLGIHDKAIESLERAIKLGYRSFSHMELDPDMDPLRDLPEYKALLEKYRAILEEEKTRLDGGSEPPQDSGQGTVSEIAVTRRPGGTFEVPCSINGLQLNMIFDTGASDVSISSVEANFMLKNNYLSEKDIKGKRYYRNANGQISPGAVVTLKEVRIGEAVLRNVEASVVSSQDAPLLFGQSAMERFGTITIDNQNNKLIIKH